MFIQSVSRDEVTEVDRDKKMRLEKRLSGDGGIRARCWEVQVTRWAPGPCGGGSVLPLSYIYPLATVRKRAEWTETGGGGGVWGH